MTREQTAIFIAEHKWDYQSEFWMFNLCLFNKYKYGAVFGFAAALLEALPFVGLVFSISNQVGAAMWAHGIYIHFYKFLC